MSNENLNIEKLFQEAYKQHTVNPSEKVLINIKRKLWWSDFFSFNPGKWNAYYTFILFAGLAVSPIVINSNDIKNETTEQPIPETVTTTRLKTIEENAPNTNISTPNQAKINNEKPEAIVSVAETEAVLRAYFTASASKGCTPLTIGFKNLSKEAKTFEWTFENGKTSTQINPSYTFTNPGTYQVTLKVQGAKGNTKTHTQIIEVFGKPKAQFKIDVMASEINTRKVSFKNLSENAVTYQWFFGDSQQSEVNAPVHTYNEFGKYKVKLVSVNEHGCADTTVLDNSFIEKDYTLAFPQTFKPNPNNSSPDAYYDHGQTSVFYPKNFGANKYELTIFMPNGIEVFKTQDIKKGWTGYVRGRLAPAGNYVYVAKGIYPNGKPFELHGNVKLIVQNFNYY